MLFIACRSRGIRFIVALQSLSQLEDNYSKSKSNIIKDACQMTMFSYAAPTAYETARSFSQTLGTYTTQSESVFCIMEIYVIKKFPLNDMIPCYFAAEVI